MKRCRQDKLFLFFNYILATFFLIIALYPLYYVLIASISGADALMAGEILLYPIDISIEGYKMLSKYAEIWTGYGNTILYTFAGTIISLIVTVPMGYMLSRKTLPFRKVITVFCITTMFVNGGMIPGYLLVKELNLLDSRLLMMILGAGNVWNMILCRNFFETNIPDGIIEAARIDGCTEMRIFRSIVIPLSKAIIAVMTLYFGVAHWNSYYNALIYLQDKDKWPLQLVIRQLLNSTQINVDNISNAVEQFKAIESMKYSLLVVASLPMLVLYPFVQKYFVQGIMIGSVKE